MPKVSVIIPIYNVEQYLRRCLDSVINQTFSDWEAICVNDGSPDNSDKILEEYVKKDKRIKVITQENGGLSDARNVGMKKAKGDFILYLDSDDFIHPQTMEITYGFAKREKSDIVSFRKDLKSRTRLVVKMFFGESTDGFLPEGIDKKYDIDKVKHKTVDDIIMNATERSHRFKYLQIKHSYVWQNLYRRDLIKDIPFINRLIMEDIPWWSEVMLQRPKVTITRLPFYYYIPNAGSILASTNALRMIQNIGIGLMHIYKIYKEKATDAEMKHWEFEILWQYIIHSFRKVKSLDNPEDIAAARKTYTDLYKMGMLDNPSTCRTRKYRRRIKRFIGK